MPRSIWPIFAVIALAACDNSGNVRITSNTEDPGTALRVIDALQCPTDQGALTRRGTASEGGQTCTYVGPRGAEVKLHLIPLAGGSPDDVLRRFQQDLAPDADKVPFDVSAHEGPDGRGETARVRMPGLSVDASDERATVSLPGMKIEAEGDRANIRIGGLVIRADDTGSEIIADNGKATAVATADAGGATFRADSGTAVRATMMKVMSDPGPDDWRVVGYEARGPSSGPVVVATFRSRDREANEIVEDAKALVTLNVGD